MWKSLHMMVYLAYALVVMHVMLGIIQLESSPLGYGFLMMGMIALIGLHFASSIKSGKGLEFKSKPGFFYACDVAQIEENRAKIITLNGESIAIFKYDGKLSAINNVCKHQNGPLGEGKIIDGCVTCPWHGYQYEPHNGSSPPPFTEKVATYHLKLEGVKVFVNPDPLPEGTSLAPIHI
ncbi:MAG: sulfoxide reductase heme-binding subunit YedZ [Roseivirga sp.]